MQERVFRSAARILVATGGMNCLYRLKYGLTPATIAHIYPEPLPAVARPEASETRSLFWGGAVYNINSRALARVIAAMTRREGDYRLVLATAQSRDELEGHGLSGDRITRVFVPADERPRYLRLLGEQGVLVLALNWPDETPIHEDELATIFPTKTPEYLASGRPVIVHCPEHYFLARFFREHGCGEIVSDREPAALDRALARLVGSPARRAELAGRALAAAHQFAREAVVPRFVRVVEQALSHGKP